MFETRDGTLPSPPGPPRARASPVLPGAPLRAPGPVLALVVLVSAACQAGHGGSEESGGRPSEYRAGDTLVKLAGPPLHAGVAELELELTIGMLEGPPEYTLSDVSELLPLPDGSVLVHDAAMRAEPTLRKYDGNGRFVAHFGRSGEGPGEFRWPTGLARMPDGRILFCDPRLGRINVYDSAGGALETWTLGSLYQVVMHSWNRLIADTAGTVYLQWVVRPTGNRDEDRSRILRLRDGGSIVDTLMPPPLPDMPESGSVRKVRRLPSGGTSTIGYLVPYYPRYFWVLSPFGQFATGRTDRYAIDFRVPLDADQAAGGLPVLWREGQAIVSIRRNAKPLPVGEEERRDQLDYVRARLDRVEGQLEAPVPPVPEVKPLLESVRFGAVGRIWVSVSAPSVKRTPTQEEVGAAEGRPLNPWSEPVRYDVFEPDGTYLGQVAVPDGVWVHASVGDTVWTVTRDALEVPYVQRYRIAWR